MRTYQEILRFCVDWEQAWQSKPPVIQYPEQESIRERLQTLCHGVVQTDSRRVNPGDLFVAVRGLVQDGHAFTAQAAERGATIIVTEAGLSRSLAMGTGTEGEGIGGYEAEGNEAVGTGTEGEGIGGYEAEGNEAVGNETGGNGDEANGAEADGPGYGKHTNVIHVQVTSTRTLAGPLAQYVLGNPADAMSVIGVTGTNGKTTTATLIQQLLTASGAITTLLGTIEKRFPGEVIQSHLTTTGPAELASDFARARQEHSDALVMEVSSHALDQHRTDGIGFDAAIFTNLTQDHLDYHGTMEEYALAKRRLFDGLAEDARAYFFRDDTYAGFMAEQCHATKIFYGFDEGADRQATHVELSVHGSRFDLAGISFETILVGLHNVANLTAALCVCLDFDVKAETLQEALANVKGPRGRLERVTVNALPVNALPVEKAPLDKADDAAELHDAPDADNANGELHASGEDDAAELHPVVFVDYAHTPDALQHVCDTLRDVMPPSCRLHVVFGCGGDRDRGKRPLMGAIAERLAHRVTVTSDNPRSEDPMAIIEDILQGCSEPDRIHVEADRRKAIREVVMGAAAGDVVLIAGKGHETTQETAGVRVHLDDTEEARLALQSRKEVQAHKDAQARAEVHANKEAQARAEVRGGGASPINPRKENGEVA